VVDVEDAGGNLVNDNTTQVSVALTSAGGATLAGTKTQTASGGQATFTDLGVDKTGTYTLTASSSPVLTTGISNSFTIQPGTATQLAFTRQPGNSTGGSGLATQPQVTVEDAEGNAVTGDSSTQVSVALTSAGAATLSGTTTETVSSGVATFTNISVDKIGTYTLTASSSPSLTTPTSNSFTVTVGSATQLAFSTQPSSTATAGTPFAQQPVVSVEDAGGNVVTTDNSTSVSLSVSGGDGTGSLSCTANSITVSSGAATFAGCQINPSSTTPYKLGASATGLTDATSDDILVS
jgi:hypothetical protein